MNTLNEVPTELNLWYITIENWSKDSDEENYIIYSADMPVGWIGINSLLSSDKGAYIKMIALLPEYQNHGIGKYAINFIKENLKSRGYLCLCLYTDKENLRAQSCYSKCGFTVKEKLTQRMINGKNVERYKMECKLRNPADLLITDFKNPQFQTAFKNYFEEMNVKTKDWDRLFDCMNNDKNGENFAYMHMSENGSVIGFIQFTVMTMKSWYFSAEMGFIREFWVSEEYRSQGHGKDLLILAEKYFREKGIGYAILTTDTAERFYLKNGYEKNPHLSCVNEMDVFTKKLL